MPRNGENIRKRKDGRWEARIKINDKIKSVYGNSYKEVKDKRNLLLQNKTVSVKDTFSSYAQKWLEYKKISVKKSTYARYVFLVNRHILKEFRNVRVCSLNNEIVNNFILNKMTEGKLKNSGGLSNKTVCDILTVFKDIVKYINEQENTCLNISVKFPHIAKNKISILSKCEQTLLERYIVENFETAYIGVMLSLYTGLRIGEVCALKWCDIDFKDKTIKVSKTIQRIQDECRGTHIIISDPKTDLSFRTIPLPKFLYDFLKMNKQENNFYILSGNGDYIEPRTFYRIYQKLLLSAGLGKYNYHCLRHTFATRCVELGFDIKSLSEILGHSSIEITLKTYVHPTTAMKTKYMNKLCCSSFDSKEIQKRA